VEIFFDDDKFGLICNDQKILKKKFGEEMAKRIGRRLDDLNAASCLEDMRNLPGRCHELKGGRAGQLSLDLVHPQRLIFTCEGEDIGKDDGGIDWQKVRAVRIRGIDDTHE
jgi:proteic killer suppression protein